MHYSSRLMKASAKNGPKNEIYFQFLHDPMGGRWGVGGSRLRGKATPHSTVKVKNTLSKYGNKYTILNGFLRLFDRLINSQIGREVCPKTLTLSF
jgi:hypothetical protein